MFFKVCDSETKGQSGTKCCVKFPIVTFNSICLKLTPPRQGCHPTQMKRNKRADKVTILIKEMKFTSSSEVSFLTHTGL